MPGTGRFYFKTIILQIHLLPQLLEISRCWKRLFSTMMRGLDWWYCPLLLRIFHLFSNSQMNIWWGLTQDDEKKIHEAAAISTFKGKRNPTLKKSHLLWCLNIVFLPKDICGMNLWLSNLKTFLVKKIYPQFDYKFLFGHSYGNYFKRTKVLDVFNMGEILWGGGSTEANG